MDLTEIIDQLARSFDYGEYAFAQEGTPAVAGLRLGLPENWANQGWWALSAMMR
jgi:hypothetical protein